MKGRHHKKRTMKDIKFELAFVYHLSNEYYTELLRQIFRTMDTITIDIDFVNRSIERARRHEDILNKYLFAPTWSESTELIKKKNEELRGMLTSMRTVIISSKRAETKEQREAADVLMQWIKPYRKHISSRNAENESYAIWGLKHPYNKYPEIGEALKVLSLDKRFKTILSRQEEVRKLEITRERTKRDNEHKAKERRRESQVDLKMMLDTLKSLLVLYPDESEEVYKICRIIDGIIRDSHRIHRFRMTMHKKRKAKAANLLSAKGKRTKKGLPKKEDKTKEKPEEKKENKQENKPEEKKSESPKGIVGEKPEGNRGSNPKDKPRREDDPATPPHDDNEGED